MRHQHEAFGRADGSEQRSHIAAQLLDVIARLRRIRQTVPAQIERDDAAVVMKMIQLEVPVGRATAKAVNEDDGAQRIARTGINDGKTHFAAIGLRQRDGAAVEIDVDGHGGGMMPSKRMREPAMRGISPGSIKNTGHRTGFRIYFLHYFFNETNHGRNRRKTVHEWR